MVDKAREAINRGADEARSYASNTTNYPSGNTGSGYSSGSSFGSGSNNTDFGRS
jgi:hypothetical protein